MAGLKRGKPPKRRTELRPNPEKVREFLRRGRGGLGRAKGSAGLSRKRPERPAEGPLTPREWRREAFRLSGGYCKLTNTRAKGWQDRRFHVHHLVPKDELRRRGLHAHVWDPRNALWIRAERHLAHENASDPIPRAAVPAAAWEFAAEMDRFGPAGSDWATYEIERSHPLTDEGSA